MIHWTIAVPFMVCWTSAMVLVLVYNPDPQRPYREIVSWVHRCSAISLLALPALAALFNVHDYWMYLYNIREAFVWRPEDFRWMLVSAPAALSSRYTLPEQGKFNAAEKLNFIMVMVAIPIFAATGLWMWWHSHWISWLIHFFLAGMVTPLMLGHIFMATVNPGTRIGLSGMISGYVDRQWARHHYGLWYLERVALEEPPASPVLEAEPGTRQEDRPLSQEVSSLPSPAAPPTQATAELATPDASRGEGVTEASEGASSSSRPEHD
jgi:formate dehydrogenase gamma subunit